MSKDIVVLSPDQALSPDYVQAVNVIQSKEIPRSAIKTREGKAGKTFTYVDHVWVTETLQDGVGHLWSFEVLGWEVFREKLTIGGQQKDSRSIAATCKFTLHVPLESGGFLNRVTTEVGVFEPNASMSTAFAVASAVSRGLCRCVMRSLGIGIQFYKSEEDQEVTIDDAWTSLARFAANQVGKEKWKNETSVQFLEALKEKGITREAANLVDRYSEAYNILATLIGKVAPTEEMPG
jgi:hypothetical protein